MVADVERPGQPGAGVGLLRFQPEAEEDVAQEGDPRGHHPGEHGRHERVVGGLGERDLDRERHGLVDAGEEELKTLAGVAHRLRQRDQVGRVLAFPQRECGLDQLAAVLEVPVETAARGADDLRQAVDGNGGNATFGDRVQRGSSPIVFGCDAPYSTVR